MAGEPSALYTLGTRLKVNSDGLNPLNVKLREIGRTAKATEKTILGLAGALKTTSEKGSAELEKVKGIVQEVAGGVHDTVIASRSLVRGFRDAASAAAALRREVKGGFPAPRAPRPGRSSNRAPEAEASDGGNFFGMLVGGGMGAMLGTGIGSIVGGGPGALFGGVVGSGADATIGSVASLYTMTARLGAQAETTKANLSGLFMSINGLDADKAAALGGVVYGQLRSDAARGVGSLDDYTRAYTELYTPLAQSGASLDQIRNLTKLSIGQGAVMRGRLGMELAPLDIVQALTSGLSERQTPFAMAALRASGANRKEFDSADALGKIAIIVKGFEAFRPAMEELGHTFEAESDTFTNSVEQFTRDMTGPLFDSLKKGLGVANMWTDVNAQTMSNLSSTLGSFIGAIGLAGSTILKMGLNFASHFSDSSGEGGYSGDAVSKLMAQMGMDPSRGSGGMSGLAGDVLGRIYGFASDVGPRVAATSVLLGKQIGSLGLYSSPSGLYNEMFGAGSSVYDSQFRSGGIWTRQVPPWVSQNSADPLSGIEKSLRDLIDQYNKDVAADRTVSIKIDPIRIEWGNDRQAAADLTTLLTDVVYQAVNARQVATSPVFALSGAS